jgi:hypothetical protein
MVSFIEGMVYHKRGLNDLLKADLKRAFSGRIKKRVIMLIQKRNEGMLLNKWSPADFGYS